MSENRKIMTAIRDGLNQLGQHGTNDILTKLCEIGRNPPFDCKVGASPTFVCEAKRDWGEWLYDLTWLKYDNNSHDKHLIDVSLVAECEWALGARDQFSTVKEDFHKLLLARASVRLMIYPYYALEGNIHGTEPNDHDARKNAAKNVAEQLAKSVNAFKCRQENDAWLLVGGVWHGRGCCYFTIDRNGKVVDFP